MVDLAAASAAESHASLDLDEWRSLVEAGEASAMGVRDMMLAIVRLENEQKQLASLRDAIVDRYATSIAKRQASIDEIRDSIETWIIRFNEGRKVLFPDVGTAYLTTRKARAAVKDAEALRAWFDEHTDPETRKLAYVERFDARAALAWALESTTLTPAGDILDAESGEVVEVPGVETLPEQKTLALRGPSA